MSKLDELRKAASNAKCGAWTASATEITEAEEIVGWAAIARTHEHNGDYDDEELARTEACEDAAFVRACSPDVVEGLIDRLARALSVLRAAEWCGSVRVEHYSGPDSYEPACPLCGGEPLNLDVARRQAMGHAGDCPLAAVLREGET